MGPAPVNLPASHVPKSSRPADPSHGSGRTKSAVAPIKKKSNKGVLLLALFLIIGGAGIAVYYFVIPNYFAMQNKNSIEPFSVPNGGVAPNAAEADYIRNGWQKDASLILQNFLAATTSAEKLPYILHGDSMAEQLKDFYGDGVIDDSDTPADAFSIYKLSAEENKRGLFMMIFEPASQGAEPMRAHAFFKRTPEGLKLDWAVFAQTKYRTLKKFVEHPKAGETGIFRVFIVENEPDKSKLKPGTRSYLIVDPANTTDTVRVNVKENSETGRALSVINWRGTKKNSPITRTATVELKWTDGNKAPALEISRLICWEFLGLGGKDPAASASSK